MCDRNKSTLIINKILTEDAYRVTILLKMCESDKHLVSLFGDVPIEVGGPVADPSISTFVLPPCTVLLKENFNDDPNGVSQTFSVALWGQTPAWNEVQANLWSDTTSSKVVAAVTDLRLQADNFTGTTATEF